MNIDVYTATGTKKGTATLPKALFEAPVNEGLMHQAVVRAQSNKRKSISSVKRRGDISGSTRKLFQQKGTGRARRGSVRSPILRGGSKSFGPSKLANYVKDMPKKMRRASLFSALSAQAKNGIILGLENYPDTIKTKDAAKLLEKMPVDIGRRILIVTSDAHPALTSSMKNIPGVTVIMAQYLNPLDILGSRHIVFLVDALKKTEEIFGGVEKKEEKAPAKKPAAKKTTTASK
ncbi:MAG: 50S ribosomal protein L4 [Candidatus Peribacter sp.]|jgi:large subunit ribosomal protein L4|nr:50S ribosomal protein L4 [Candidatus Peribacter sp.]MBT4392530.1 50S ribosomal protein L4 [Candidatus Peribacter sp.]MBT4601389.1 50S ribosomal protein L4 [Candidatus Peribacter sp.]MBT5149527.1 50S ribosomal protein L4 [Candidatus Peribacter sp.]MBT5638079.1 50S ribosomal protein L4 [Candidatus Peribacter sp.]